MSLEISTVRDVDDELVAAFARLLPQLSRTAAPPDAATLRAMVGWPGTSVLTARVDGPILGLLTLVTFPIPTGVRARIEDVVVDSSARGRGAGAALTQEALRLARSAGARTVDLTSRPSREAANRLYERLGFQRRDSAVYRISFEEAGPGPAA